MLRLLFASLVAAIVIGYVAGGRLSRLADARFRLPWVGAAGIVLQFLPLDGRLGDVVLTLSFVLLLVAAVANLRLPGFALLVVGLGLNFAVITVNRGMPVDPEAVIASGQAGTLQELGAADSVKHHLMTSDDRLTILADVIAIPAPIRQAVSVGDLAAIAGAMWFVIGAMLGAVPAAQTRERAPTPETS
jgi:hypothetical protein